MSITPPPPAPSRQDPATFSDRADAFAAWLVAAVPQFNALAAGSIDTGNFFNLTVSGQITGNAITQSAIDTTPGRLLKVGDWGLGGGGTQTPPSNDADNAVRPGFYAATSATANLPAPATTTGALLVTRSLNVVNQEFIASQFLRFFRRSTNGGDTWSTWRQAAPQTLGTVSQSGGEPIGALMQKPEFVSGRGWFVRLANGLQVCWTNDLVFTEAGSGERLEAADWTFPAAFLAGATPHVGFRMPGSTQGGISGPNWPAAGSQIRKVSLIGCGTGSGAAVQPRIHAVTGQTFEPDMTITCGAFAVGPWSNLV